MDLPCGPKKRPTIPVSTLKKENGFDRMRNRETLFSNFIPPAFPMSRKISGKVIEFNTFIFQ